MTDAAAGSEGRTDTAAHSSGGTSRQHDPPCFLIVYNITKRHNIGNIARSASAFGVAQVCGAGDKLLTECQAYHDIKTQGLEQAP
jgi:tRNA G18 (ribose-2'-O)-methylase SpoU